MIILGIDTGGTFTDFVLLRLSPNGQTEQPLLDNQLLVHKVLSTPKAPEQAILQGIRELDQQQALDDDLLIVHGSTVATNAVLEGKGVRTAFITNRGMGDMLTIGRQARRELYNLQPSAVAPPVAKELCLETGGRLGADGSVVDDLTEEDIERLRFQLRKLAPQAVAINLLFSFLNPDFERRIEIIVPRALFVSRSSAVLPEYKEYERGITTWLNAAVGPIVKGYLERLNKGLAKQRPDDLRTHVSVMQSSGGTIDAQQAAQQSVQLLLSGPAGGMAGAQYVAGVSGRERLLTFDMGGTSTDVALIDGELQLTSEGHIGPYPVAVPMVDMHTIGAGGGSIASVDAGGLLQVGPQSAGADPGPACYGKGGTLPTVTDANLVLGRLRADAFLGGAMALDIKAAQDAIVPLAQSMEMSVEQAAQGIIRVANEHMARALRVMSVQRGVDSRGLTLVSFGGAGGLHVCALADALTMKQALVPVHAGVLSALGMLVAPRTRHLSHSYTRLLNTVDLVVLEQAFKDMSEQGLAALKDEDVAVNEVSIQRRVDLRYQGQSYCLTLEWQDLDKTEAAFHQAHETRYGHQLELPVELVTLRVQVSGPKRTLPSQAKTQSILQRGRASQLQPRAQAHLVGIEQPVPVYARNDLLPNRMLNGPALITETVSTTFIAPGWQCNNDMMGNLLLSR